jgi:hypothetical protein
MHIKCASESVKKTEKFYALYLEGRIILEWILKKGV